MAGNESGAYKKLLNAAGRAEDVVMIGSMPCRLASEVHVDGQHIARKAVKLNDGTKGEADARRRMIIGSKHPRTLTAEGREVVGPGYSTCSHTVVGSDGQFEEAVSRKRRTSEQ
jgi:hypothetical protein